LSWIIANRIEGTDGGAFEAKCAGEVVSVHTEIRSLDKVADLRELLASLEANFAQQA